MGLRSKHVASSVALAALLFGGTASAQGAAPTDPATTPAAPVASSTTASPTSAPDEDTSQNLVLQRLGLGSTKPWNVGTIFETHRLLRQDDLGGAARNKAYNYLYLYASWMPTPKDQIQVRGGFYQRFLADETETGIRTDDMQLAYTRTVPLPWELMLRPSVAHLFPISFESRMMGMISSPRASVSLMRNFLDNNLNVNLRVGGAGYIQKYKSAPGGSANPYASTNIGVGVNYSMPFHNSLQVGANAYTSYYFNHEVEGGLQDNVSGQFKNAPIGVSKDTQFADQPMQQTYGGEVYVGYQLPNLMDAQSNVQLSLAQGEPNVIHDGARHVYWMFRRSAQVYLALQVQY